MPATPIATPIENIRVRYTLVRPDGRKFNRVVDVTGAVANRRWLVDTALHGQPIGSKIEDMRQVGPNDEEIAEQPAFFLVPITPRRAAPANPRHGFHPGVERQVPSDVATDDRDEIKTEHTPLGATLATHKPTAPIPRVPPNPDTVEEAKKFVARVAEARPAEGVVRPTDDRDALEAAEAAGELAQAGATFTHDDRGRPVAAVAPPSEEMAAVAPAPVVPPSEETK